MAPTTGLGAELDTAFRLEPGIRFNPLIITHLAVDRGLAEDLEASLAKAFVDIQGAETEDGDLPDEGSSLDDPLTVAKFLAPVDGYPSPLLSRYLEYVEELSPELFRDTDALGLQAAILAIWDDEALKDEATFQSYVTHFASLPKILHAYERRRLMALYPFLPLIYKAIPDADSAGGVNLKLSRATQGKKICKVDEVSNRWEEPWIEYTQFVALNDSDVLCLRCELVRYYGSIDKCLPHFDLFCAGVDPRSYVNDPSVVHQFFDKWGEIPSSYEVDWAEVSHKAIMRRKVRQPEIQGLNRTLYRAIVDCLEQQQTALRLFDLRRLLCIDDIPLSPFDLPPGRLLAYAPSPRFYRKETAFYVLRDWVEDQDHRRRRIAKSRVVTPLERRHFEIGEAAIDRALERSELLSQHGCVLADMITDDLGRELVGMQVPPYYQRKIAKAVTGTLRRRYQHVGRGIYVDRRLIGPIADQSEKSARLKAFRRILSSYLSQRDQGGSYDDAGLGSDNGLTL